MKPKLIKGAKHTDDRGSITFINDLDMYPIRRFYYISPKDTSVIRAWQGHKKESKWFHVLSGKFTVKLIQIDNWTKPSKALKCADFILSSEDCEALFIPGGFVNGFRALEKNSCMLVYSDATLEESKFDDFRFDLNYWPNW